LKANLFPVSSRVFKRIFIKKKLVEYISDLGIVLENFFQNDFFKNIDFVETTVDLRNLDSVIPIFAQVNFWLLQSKDKYFLNYIKPQFFLRI
jgi:hypothetical protein